MTLREKFPSLFAFGDDPPCPLDAMRARLASRDERIRSVWPLLAKLTLAFQQTLRPRERANFDVEDVLNELWLKLAERDHKFDPDRARYSSFAGAVAMTTLERIRDRARTVQNPGNPAARMAAYDAKIQAGTITDQERRTHDALSRVLDPQVTLGWYQGESESEIMFGDTPPPESEVIRRDEINEAVRQTIGGLAVLTPEEAGVLGEAFGLWGQPVSPLSKVASKRHRSVVAVREIAERAVIKFESAVREVRGRQAARESHPKRIAS